MNMVRIGIIGGGPRGLTILERIVANERAHRAANVHIYLFDPNLPGVECRDPEQDAFPSVNTVAAQITQFSDSSIIGADSSLEGPSFHEWLQDGRYADQAERQLDAPLSPNGYYSRALFDRYLHWTYHYLVALAPAHVEITHVSDPVLNVERVPDDFWTLSTSKDSFSVQHLFLTTRHAKPG